MLVIIYLKRRQYDIPDYCARGIELGLQSPHFLSFFVGTMAICTRYSRSPGRFMLTGQSSLQSSPFMSISIAKNGDSFKFCALSIHCILKLLFRKLWNVWESLGILNWKRRKKERNQENLYQKRAIAGKGGRWARDEIMEVIGILENLGSCGGSIH